MVYIIITYKGRKYSDIEINENDTVKAIMDIFYNKINRPDDQRFYTQDKMLLKFNDSLLNKDENSLMKTAKELEIEDDDCWTMIDTKDINAGKNNKCKNKITFDL